jgi:hypothetical protein
MTDSNRAAASAEMKAAIAGAFERDALWTTDWAGVQLQACAASLPVRARADLPPRQTTAQAAPDAWRHEAQKVRGMGVVVGGRR